MTTLYQLNWGGSSICDYIGDGLWDNNRKIAIHLPIFCKNFLNKYKYKYNKKYNYSFYISYDDNDNTVEEMKYEYFGLNDIVFTNYVHLSFKKAIIYTSIKPYYIE